MWIASKKRGRMCRDMSGGEAVASEVHFLGEAGKPSRQAEDSIVGNCKGLHVPGLFHVGDEIGRGDRKQCPVPDHSISVIVRGDHGDESHAFAALCLFGNGAAGRDGSIEPVVDGSI